MRGIADVGLPGAPSRECRERLLETGTLIEARSNDEALRALIARWRQDPRSTFQTWFLWEERLKNFRSIRRGLQLVVAEIEAGRFGNTY